MMGLIGARLGAVLAAVAAVLAAIGAVFLAGKRSGTQAAAMRESEAAREQATERSHADVDAARAADPAAELRRDWSR